MLPGQETKNYYDEVLAKLLKILKTSTKLTESEIQVTQELKHFYVIFPLNF